MAMPPRSSSAGLRRIRRELQRRRSKPLAPTKSVAKKPSASPPPRQGSSDAVRDPCHRPPHREIRSSTTSHSLGSTITDASPKSRPRASSRCISASPPPPPPPRRSVPSSTGSARRATTCAAALLRPGTVVGVSTRTTTLKTGQVLVLWLRATVVSSTHGGYEVVYDGNRPSGDPKGTVRVARHHVRAIKTKTSPPPTTPPPSLPPPTAAQKKDTLPAARPTTAGKSVRLIRSLMPEMEHQARAALSGTGY